MKIIVNLYYRNNIVDAQAHTIRKKKGKACPLELHIDAAIDNTVGPDIIAKTVRDAAEQALTAAAHNLHDTPQRPKKGT